MSYLITGSLGEGGPLSLELSQHRPCIAGHRLVPWPWPGNLFPPLLEKNPPVALRPSPNVNFFRKFSLTPSRPPPPPPCCQWPPHTTVSCPGPVSPTTLSSPGQGLHLPQLYVLSPFPMFLHKGEKRRERTAEKPPHSHPDRDWGNTRQQLGGPRQVQTLWSLGLSCGRHWRENVEKQCACALSRSVVSNFLWPPRTVVHQAPLSMGFSRLEYWGGLPFPPPGDLLEPGIKPSSPESPAFQADIFFLPLSYQWSPDKQHTAPVFLPWASITFINRKTQNKHYF